MVRLGFGSNGGPLIWSRFAAAMGRLGQAMLRPQHHLTDDERWIQIRSTLHIYLDDPIFTLAGNAQHRRRELASVLLVWAASGFKVSWPRGQVGSGLNWIGVEYITDLAARTITVQIPEAAIKEALALATELLSKPMGPLRVLRRLAGKGS